MLFGVYENSIKVASPIDAAGVTDLKKRGTQKGTDHLGKDRERKDDVGHRNAPQNKVRNN